MSVSDRIKKLEQRPQPQHQHGMTQKALDLYVNGLTTRGQVAFVKSMTDEDLSASIDYLTNLSEPHHANN